MSQSVSLCSSVAPSYTQVLSAKQQYIEWSDLCIIVHMCMCAVCVHCMYLSMCARFLCACACLALLTTLQRNEVISCRRSTQPLLRDVRGVKRRWEVYLVATILHYLALSCTIMHYLAPFCTILHYLTLSCTGRSWEVYLVATIASALL